MVVQWLAADDVRDRRSGTLITAAASLQNVRPAKRHQPLAEKRHPPPIHSQFEGQRLSPHKPAYIVFLAHGPSGPRAARKAWAILGAAPLQALRSIDRKRTTGLEMARGLMRSSELNHDAPLENFDAVLLAQTENFGRCRALPICTRGVRRDHKSAKKEKRIAHRLNENLCDSKLLTQRDLLKPFSVIDTKIDNVHRLANVSKAGVALFVTWVDQMNCCSFSSQRRDNAAGWLAF